MTPEFRHYTDRKEVRPYRRGENGRYIPHPSFEGWRPDSEPRDITGWVLVAACAVIALLALHHLGH